MDMNMIFPQDPLQCPPTQRQIALARLSEKAAAMPPELLTVTVTRETLEGCVLEWLYELWTSEDAAALRQKMAAKDNAFEGYYKHCFIYLADDVARTGGMDVPLVPWFDKEADFCHCAIEWFSKHNVAYEPHKLEELAHAMVTLEGFYQNGRPDPAQMCDQRVSRTCILWTMCHLLLANFYCYRDPSDRDLFKLMRQLEAMSSELTQAGFDPFSRQNCLDLYLAISAYHQMLCL